MKRIAAAIAALFVFGALFGANTITKTTNGLKITFNNNGDNVRILRSTGKFSPFTEITTTTGTSYTDNSIGANPYNYYYKVMNGDTQVALLSLETELFGKNVYFYHPTDDMAQVANEINTIHDAMMYDQFSENRYSFYLHKGSYLETGDIKIAYYMSIAGLGKLPYDVDMFYLVTPPPLANNNATCTFWRSAENFEVIATNDAVMAWGVSQAAPLRRVVMNRPCQFDYWYGYASGGFAADCYFADDAGSYSQQQFYSRNCYMENGQGRYAGGWNYALQGIEFGKNANIAANSDNWSDDDKARGWGNVSREETTPVIREKPFLFFDEATNRFKVFRPALREKDSKGISYTQTDMGKGDIIDLIDNFFIAKPTDKASDINAQLRNGKHIFFTPGQYILEEPLYVTKANTILLGTGYATLIPGNSNPIAAVVVGDVDGVTVASLLFDTFYSSENLLRVGQKISTKDHSANPTLLADLFFRIGGFKKWDVNVDVALKINSSDVIGDHFWIWRADHGDGVGWDNNTCKNGLVVEGQDVTIYGLFNEHFQQYQTLWKGENGRMFFYQCETPYDVLDQDDYISHGGVRSGFASYKVAPGVMNHYASMMGIYDVFINTQGAEIKVANSIEVPKTPGVHVHHACNTCISNVKAGFDHIINDSVTSTFHFENISGRKHITDYQWATTVDEGEVMPEDESGNEGSTTPSWSAATGEPDAVEEIEGDKVAISVYPNPVVSYLQVMAPSGTDMHVSVYSMSGECVASGRYSDPIFMGNLANGYYIVKVTTDEQTSNFKIIKR